MIYHNFIVFQVKATNVRTFPEDAFSDAPHVTKLEILDNLITSMHDDVFRGLPNLLTETHYGK